MSYHHKPGSVKAKEREERQRREQAELQQSSKIQKFFTPIACAHNTNSLSTSAQAMNVEPVKSLTNNDVEVYNSDACSADVEESLNNEAELGSDKQAMVVKNCDIELWPNGKLPDSFVHYWLERGVQDCQHIDSNFRKFVQDDGKQKRWFSRSLFSRTHSLNGEKISRS